METPESVLSHGEAIPIKCLPGYTDTGAKNSITCISGNYYPRNYKKVRLYCLYYVFKVLHHYGSLFLFLSSSLFLLALSPSLTFLSLYFSLFFSMFLSFSIAVSFSLFTVCNCVSLIFFSSIVGCRY